MPTDDVYSIFSIGDFKCLMETGVINTHELVVFTNTTCLHFLYNKMLISNFETKYSLFLIIN